MARDTPNDKIVLAFALQSKCSGFANYTSYTLTPQPIRGCLYLVRPSYVYNKFGNGILTVLPSTTPIGLVLGLD